MKQQLLLFGLLFSFGFGFAQTKDSLSVEEQEKRRRNIEAGNPFKKFGYTPKIATLSKGKYLEWHDLDSIVRIGSYSFHVKKKDITGYNMDEDKNSESTLRPELTSRWLSPDPLAEEFPSWSPYNFVMNNPLRYNDPLGLAPDDVIISGTLKQEAFEQLQVSVQNELTLSMDESGKVTYTQTGEGKLSKDAQQLVNAIDNNSIVVNVLAENTLMTEAGELYIGGAFSGNTVTVGETGNTVSTKQEVNPNVLGQASDAHGKPGANMLHEVTESYQGALISQKKGVSSSAAGTKGSVYKKAHRKATKQSGRIYERIYDASGNEMQMLPGNIYPAGVKSVDWYVNDKKGNKTVIQKLN